MGSLAPHWYIIHGLSPTVFSHLAGSKSVSASQPVRPGYGDKYRSIEAPLRRAAKTVRYRPRVNGELIGTHEWASDGPIPDPHEGSIKWASNQVEIGLFKQIPRFDF